MRRVHHRAPVADVLTRREQGDPRGHAHHEPQGPAGAPAPHRRGARLPRHRQDRDREEARRRRERDRHLGLQGQLAAQRERHRGDRDGRPHRWHDGFPPLGNAVSTDGDFLVSHGNGRQT